MSFDSRQTPQQLLKGERAEDLFCWICHTKCVICCDDDVSPCDCKGSLRNVHRHCLNFWATRRYRAILDQISGGEIYAEAELEEKMKIMCPNCKQELDYEVKELPPRMFNFAQPLTSNHFEKFLLLFMIIVQITLLYLDNEDHSETEQASSALISPPQSFVETIGFTYSISLITTLTVLGAALYNLLFDFRINWAIEINSKEKSAQNNNCHSIKAQR